MSGRELLILVRRSDSVPRQARPRGRPWTG